MELGLYLLTACLFGKDNNNFYSELYCYVSLKKEQAHIN